MQRLIIHSLGRHGRIIPTSYCQWREAFNLLWPFLCSSITGSSRHNLDCELKGAKRYKSLNIFVEIWRVVEKSTFLLNRTSNMPMTLRHLMLDSEHICYKRRIYSPTTEGRHLRDCEAYYNNDTITLSVASMVY